MQQYSPRQLLALRSTLFVLCLTPLAYLLAKTYGRTIPGEPVEFIQRWTGYWALTLLLLTLSITPLRTITQQHWLLRLRRMLGLFAFAYASLHFLAFIGLEHSFEISAIAVDTIKRPHVSPGFAALALLIPLAATSNQWALRRLGGRRWQELHRNVYLIGILGCAHYLWLADAGALGWPLGYTLVLSLLLGWRMRERRRKAIPFSRHEDAKPIRFFRKKPD